MAEQFIDYDTFVRMRAEIGSSLEERLNLSPNAKFVCKSLYQKNLETGRKETISERIAAIAIDTASAEMPYFPASMSKQDKLEKIRASAQACAYLQADNVLRFNTPTNINFGRYQAKFDEDGEITGYDPKKQLGSACFVIKVGDTFGDSIESLEEGLLEAWVAQQQLHKGGGGTGFSLVELRPKGSIIGYNPAVDGMGSIDWGMSRGVSSGAESFLQYFYNASTEAVKQGNTRRGANMAVQRIDHMDFLDHIFAKFGTTTVGLEFKNKNVNASMAVTDEFMDAVEQNGTYTLFNPLRADPKIKRVLERKYGIENPEIVRKGDIATQEQFEAIKEKNNNNPFAPVTTPNMYLNKADKVINAYTGEEIGSVMNDIVYIDAKKVFDTLCKLAHANGEPGLFFIDRANEHNPLLNVMEIQGVNPCGEQPLFSWEACNLGSINVGKFVRYEIFGSEAVARKTLDTKILEDQFTKFETRTDGKVGIMHYDWEGLDKVIGVAIRCLDNIVDRNDFPGERIKEIVKKTRKIGLGYMGVADAMILMKKRYGSEESLEFVDALAKKLHDKSLETSQALAEEKGAFPLIEGSVYDPESDLFEWYNSKPQTIQDRFRGSRKLSNKVDRTRHMTRGVKVRNAARTTQAPTGTIRRFCGEIDSELDGDNFCISSGIEPLFSLWEESPILNTMLCDFSLATKELLKREGIYSPKLVDAIIKNKGSVHQYSYTTPEVAVELNKIPEDVRNVLVTASGGEGDTYEIISEAHSRTLAGFQRWNDSGISKTFNLPQSTMVKGIEEAYLSMWKLGAKGGTVYVDKSRKFQILNTSEGDSVEENNGKLERALMQRSVTFEAPYISSSTPKEGGGEVYHPSSCFTTIAWDPRGRITSFFQNVAETDPERVSNIVSRGLHLSRAFKEGRPLEKMIKDEEKLILSGGRMGTLTDEGVMQISGSDERMKHQISCGTSAEGALMSLYVMNFLTEGGTNFDNHAIQEKIDMYHQGGISLRTIINSKGKVILEEDTNGNPSILDQKKVLVLPEGFKGNECPECG